MDNKIFLKTDTIIDDSIIVSKWVIKELLQGKEEFKSVFLFNTIIKESSLDNPKFNLKEDKNIKSYLAVEIKSFFYDFDKSFEDVNWIKGFILFKKEIKMETFKFFDIVYFQLQIEHEKNKGLNFAIYDSRVPIIEDKNNILYMRAKRFKDFKNSFIIAKQTNKNFI